MKTLKTFFALYVSNAREFVREKMSLLFTLLLPPVFAGFFGLIFSSAQGPTTVKLGLAVNQADAAAQQFAATLAQSAATSTIVISSDTRDAQLASLQKGALDAVIVLPDDLGEALAAGRTAEAEILFDPTRQVSAGQALTVAREVLHQANLALASVKPPLALVTKAISNNQPRMVDAVIPGMLGVAMLWLGLFGTAMPLVGLREQQVLRRLSVTPLSRATLLSGQVAWRVTVGGLQALVFVLFGWLAFGVQVSGNWAALVAAVLLGTLVFVVLGFLLAGISPSQDACTAITQLVNFPLMFLSGAFFSIDMLPSFLRPVVDLMPLAYLCDSFRQLMAGYPPMYPLWLDFAVLGVWLVALSGLSLRFFRWE